MNSGLIPRIVTVDVPANRKEELKQLRDSNFAAWKESLRIHAEAVVGYHESRRRLEVFHRAIDRISDEPRDWLARL